MAELRPLAFNDLPNPAADPAAAWEAWQLGNCDLAALCSYAAEEGLEPQPGVSKYDDETLMVNGMEFTGVRPFTTTYEQVAVGGLLRVGDRLQDGHVTMHELGLVTNYEDGSSTLTSGFTFYVHETVTDDQLELVERHRMPMVSVTMRRGEVLEEGIEPPFDADPNQEIPQPSVAELVDMHTELRRTAEVARAMIIGHGMRVPAEFMPQL